MDVDEGGVRRAMLASTATMLGVALAVPGASEASYRSPACRFLLVERSESAPVLDPDVVEFTQSLSVELARGVDGDATLVEAIGEGLWEVLVVQTVVERVPGGPLGLSDYKTKLVERPTTTGVCR